MTLLSASLYAADPFRLAEEIDAVTGSVESFHLDVMDGRFAPEYGLTTRLVRELRELTSLPLDVHLMVDNPAASAVMFAEMRIRSIAIHVESDVEFAQTANIVRSHGVKVYAALRHTTSTMVLDSMLDHIDGCLLLTAPAGGGSFDVNAFERLATRPRSLYTVVDGKIGPEHFGRLKSLDVSLAVVGAAMFSAGPTAPRSRELLASLERAASVR
ncbi:hypothetical protein [Rhizobium sp. AG207R]|uniref:hypothetical protein n=1 Tax=Rhizobium sp. AG207R TaxID=2802287 RepID=UPI0022AC7713|nr:hypothetical protein [Rhizobium sp. AG207R]MCZ3378151.1 hypothetical protein [Rhizobium sp. AG207R]